MNGKKIKMVVKFTNISTTVYVGNIPFNVPVKDVKTLFKQVGEVTGFVLPDKCKGKRKTKRLVRQNYAFIRYKSPEMAAAAFKYDGHELAGRKLKVEKVKLSVQLHKKKE